MFDLSNRFWNFSQDGLNYHIVGPRFITDIYFDYIVVC